MLFSSVAFCERLLVALSTRSYAEYEPSDSILNINESSFADTSIPSISHAFTQSLHNMHSDSFITTALLSTIPRIYYGHSLTQATQASHSTIFTCGVFLYPQATPACHFACSLPWPSLTMASSTSTSLSFNSTIGMFLSAISILAEPAGIKSPE